MVNRRDLFRYGLAPDATKYVKNPPFCGALLLTLCAMTSPVVDAGS